MDLQQISGELSDGLDRTALAASVEALLDRLPADYVELLQHCDGITFSSGGLLYASADIEERNATYEVADYEPGYVAIGDNGGGDMLLLKEEAASPIYIGGMGSLGSLPLEFLADSVTQWVAMGCPCEAEGDGSDVDAAWAADVYLDVLPEGKLKNLIAIKNGLGLTDSISTLKALTDNLPACIARNVPAGKFRVRCEALNERFGNCLSLRTD
jgi:hypothetical protein